MPFTLHPNFCQNLDIAIKQKISYELRIQKSIEEGGSGEYGIYFLDHSWSRYFSDSTTTDKTRTVVAAILNLKMQEALEKGQKDPELMRSSQNLLSSLKRMEDPVPYQTLRDHVLAMRFDLPVHVLETYPDFTDFLESNFLHRYLKNYNHEITLSPAGEPQILFNGEWELWSTVKERVPMSETGALKNHRYTYCGLKEGTHKNWKEWEPYMWKDPAGWDHQYVFEVCCNCTNSPKNLTGDHTWLKIYTPEGWVYSVGIYRDGKDTSDTVGVGCVQIPRDHLDQTTSIKPAYLYSPDISDFHPMPFTTWRFAFDGALWPSFKKGIEEDKARGVYFHMLRHNCTKFTKDKARQLGVEIPSEIPAARVLFSQVPGVVPTADAVSPYLTSLGRRVADAALTVLINSVQYGLGGTEVHRSTVRAEHMPDPVLQGLSDWFKRENVQMHHPYFVGRVTKQMVEDYHSSRPHFFSPS